MGWFVFDIIINYLEMLTSCWFAARLFQKEEKVKIGHNIWIFLFALFGMIMLMIREYIVVSVPDFVPAILTFFLFSWLICKTKAWTAVLWALLNYLFLGIIAISCISTASILFEVPIEELRLRTGGWVVMCVVSRLAHLMVAALLLNIMRKFKRTETNKKSELGLIFVSASSIILLMLLWNVEINLTEDFILYTNVSTCMLILGLNFGILIFREILSREKFYNEELREHNRLISMQIRSQNEISEIYNNLRGLKHDMNNHLHTISGYMQMEEYEKAEKYIQNIIGEVSAIESCRSGNQTIDALIGSKTTLAKAQGISINIDISVPAELKVASEDLVIILGNLYDNAIDANLKIEEYDKRYINIRMLYRNGNLIISFENASCEKERDNGSFWKTTKKDKLKHGFGIRNIDRIVQQYDGYCQRELKNHVFLCQIMIPAGKE